MKVSKHLLSSAYRNMVVPLSPIGDDDAAILADHAVDFFGSPSVWTIWSVYLLHLEEGGFVHLSDNPVMERRTKDLVSVSPVPGLSIEEVDDGVGVTAFERIREAANGRTFPPVPPPGEYFDSRVLGNGHRLWLGSIDDEVVATAASFETKRVNLIKNIATFQVSDIEASEPP